MQTIYRLKLILKTRSLSVYEIQLLNVVVLLCASDGSRCAECDVDDWYVKVFTC